MVLDCCNSPAIARRKDSGTQTGTCKLFNRRLHTYSLASCGNSRLTERLRDPVLFLIICRNVQCMSGHGLMDD